MAKRKSKPRFFGKSRLSSEKKKTLGTLVILAFVAFFAITLTRYIVAFDIGLETTAIASLSISLLIVTLMEFKARLRKMPKRKVKKSKKR